MDVRETQSTAGLSMGDGDLSVKKEKTQFPMLKRVGLELKTSGLGLARIAAFIPAAALSPFFGIGLIIGSIVAGKKTKGMPNSPQRDKIIKSYQSQGENIGSLGTMWLYGKVRDAHKDAKVELKDLKGNRL